ncbi:hypothetical protein GF369_01550 [Candidatus Peregrinibacteria bacterium]|nr:hypothetical protein [Candidatus Peregrinibacteria bacterium]
MFEQSSTVSHKRIIRIFVCAAAFFILINAGISVFIPSYEQTGRASEMLLSNNVCNFSLADFSDIDNMLAHDTKRKIIILGDSVAYGIGVEHEAQSISGYIRNALPDYSVYNLSSCGSKPLDYYLWLKKLKDEDALFLIQYNYKWFATDNGELRDRVSQKRLLTQFNEYVDESVRKSIGNHVTHMDIVSHTVSRLIPAASHKTSLFVHFFNEKSKEDVIEHLFFGKPEKQSMAYKKRYWKEKDEMKRFNCAISYPNQLWDAERNVNVALYQVTLAFIEENNLDAHVIMPPYNQELVDRCMKTSFRENVQWFIDEASRRGVESSAYIDSVDERYFLDDMHLNSEGNNQLATMIINDIVQ